MLCRHVRSAVSIRFTHGLKIVVTEVNTLNDETVRKSSCYNRLVLKRNIVSGNFDFFLIRNVQPTKVKNIVLSDEFKLRRKK